MLQGLTVDSVLFNLSQSNFIFELTGSRYFGGAISSSDYDFMTQESHEVETFLLNEGFRTISYVACVAGLDVRERENATLVPTKLDKLTSKVFRKGNDHELHYDVQLVKDLKAKVAVQECLKKLNLIYGAPKHLRSKIWDAMIDLYQSDQINKFHSLAVFPIEVWITEGPAEGKKTVFNSPSQMPIGHAFRILRTRAF